MAWKLEKHKSTSTIREIRVSSLIRQMSECCAAKDSESFTLDFKNKLKFLEVKKTDSDSLFYRSKPIDKHKLEIWKLKASGDFNYKMFTLTYAGENANPFTF